MTHAADPDAMARPASITATKGTTTYWSTGTYGYDGAGNVTAIGDSYFLYDKVSRLATGTVSTSSLGTGSLKTRSYTYDAFGNIQSIAGSPGRSTPTSAATNRLTGTAVYDASGNLTSWNGNAYEYDALNMMTRMTSGAEDWLYVYTADDERVWQYKLTSGPPFHRYTLRDLSGQVLREYTSAGDFWTVERDYVYRGGQLLAAATPADLRHFHLDHLGTPRLITNASGQWVAYHVYYPFGEEATNAFQDEERMKFTGHERDLADVSGTGDDLDYMHARHCSPLTGRFMSVDPINSGDPRVPQSWNKFTYTLGNPMNSVDPKGLIVHVLDVEALRLIKATLSGTLGEAVSLDEAGAISRAALNAVNTDDANFLALRDLVNSSILFEVSTAAGFRDRTGASETFMFESVEQVRKEMAAILGEEAAGALDLIDNSLLGVFNPPAESLRGTAEVILSDGTGKASTAPFPERVITAAHELYGHALLFSQGKPWKHDRGAVDKAIIDVEARTRSLFE